MVHSIWGTHKGNVESGMLKQWPTLDIPGSNQYQVRAQVDMAKSHFIPSARDEKQRFLIFTALNLTQTIWNSLIPFWRTISILFLLQSVWKVMYAVQIQRRESRKLLMNGQCRIQFLVEAIALFIYIEFDHRANNYCKYAGGFHNSMIDDKDGHIASPRIMFTCTTLRHALLEWQKNKGIHPKASKLNREADRPDPSNYFNSQNDGGKNASCCAATGRKLLSLPGIADTYTFLMNSLNTLPESYQQSVYDITLATVKRQIQQAENPIPAVVISVEAARVDNAILLDYSTSHEALDEPEDRSTDPNILIDNNCTDDELHFRMPGSSGDNTDEGDESDECDIIPSASRPRQPTTQLERIDLGTSDVDRYEGEDGDNADADEEEEGSQADDGSTQNVEDSGHSGFDLETSDVGGYECEDGDDADADVEESASQADDGSIQNVEDWGHSTRECEDWTVNFRRVE